jgi:hypothetical protein
VPLDGHGPSHHRAEAGRRGGEAHAPLGHRGGGHHPCVVVVSVSLSSPRLLMPPPLPGGGRCCALGGGRGHVPLGGVPRVAVEGGRCGVV